MNNTVDANIRSEPHVFHNGWYGCKNGGIGLAAYASYHENPRAEGILRSLESEFRTRAAPALELAGDGGGWAEGYYVNYHLRSIAHNTILVHDPSETWPNIRAGRVTGNDGGQAHAWPHHNGAVADAAAWNEQQRLYDVADVAAFADYGTHVYVAGDCTWAYSPKKLECFAGQIVFERPGTFIVLDRVVSRRPEFKKTWLLQAMKRPDESPSGLVITNGKGRLFVQTLLPREPNVGLCCGEDLYRYDGNTFSPRRDTGPAPECRIEVSPSQPARVDYFLHVLTATDAAVESVRPAILEDTDREFHVRLATASISFDKSCAAGSIEIAGRRMPLETRP